MKGISCTCIVNTRNGYCFAPEKFQSINKAVEYGKTSCGFAYRVIVGTKVVRSGYCQDF